MSSSQQNKRTMPENFMHKLCNYFHNESRNGKRCKKDFPILQPFSSLQNPIAALNIRLLQ
jgi:hypothetical protein